MTHSEVVSFIWGVADLIRDTFKRGKYQDVILPLTVMRRLDCVLAPTKHRVLETYNRYKDEIDNLEPMLQKEAGFSFYNTSLYDFEKLLADAPNLAANLRNWINGFSDNMREVIEKFDFDNTITKLDEAGLLFQVLQLFKTVDLHPNTVSNHTMGTVFEELIRKFNEALNENPGEHFTPRDVVDLMVGLMLAGDREEICNPGAVITVCDPCCGSGGMLTMTKDYISGSETRVGINPDAEVHVFGQEVNPETFAVCKSDLFMKDPTGQDADAIKYGSVLGDDRHTGRRFDYLIANPPYGKDWKRDKDDVLAEAARGAAGRFDAGTPTIADGQLLFVQHMLFHMRTPDEGGSRIAVITNGSPLSTGPAGSGSSEIRRWIFENDWLEALIAVPEQLFYNTGIATFVWVLTNRKDPERAGKVQLIDATSFWVPMRKSLGDKRREISDEKATEILEILATFEESEVCKIYPTTHFGYRKITVDRPLRLNFEASPERIARLDDERAFQNLAMSKKKDPDAKAKEEAKGRAQQDTIKDILVALPKGISTDREALTDRIKAAAKHGGLKLSAPVLKALLAALMERDENAAVCTDKNGGGEADPSLRDTEKVPFGGGSVEEYFEREVLPHARDAWINETVRDSQDGEVGKVGYEINFNRYFYKPQPMRTLEKIRSDILALERETEGLLGEIIDKGEE